MNVHRLMMLVAAVLLASRAPVFAGPCTDEIQRMVDRLSTLLEAGDRSGPSAAESSAARLHRQPTPGSIAAVKALDAAYQADRLGNQSACEQALADARRLVGP
jgi:hypothetical protein